MPEQFPAFVCPAHGTALEHTANGLQCAHGHSFSIVRDIPRFVEGSSYAAAFGAQWLRYRHTELDSVTGRTDTRDRLRSALGEELWRNLDGTSVLECGCGPGRFTEVLLERGAAVTAVDLSEAVDANRDNFGHADRYRVAQADIRALPFPDQSYQIVLCLGVVQHTPDPEQTIAALYRYVAPGGWLVIDHYALSVGWYLSLKPLYRAWLKRLPPTKTLPITEWLVNRFLPLHRRADTSRVAQSLLGRVSPVMHLYGVVQDAGYEQQRAWAMVLTHDSLTDWYKHRRSPAQIGATLARLGMEDIRSVSGGNGVEARGRRPVLR